MNQQPIGVFDSGVGGLSVVSAIRQAMPNEDIVYLGDSAHLPYGTKPRATIVGYAFDAVSFLLTYQVKVIVIACHTATAQTEASLRKEVDLPIVGMIQPTLNYLRMVRQGTTTILATESTKESRAYPYEVVACPSFVPLVETSVLDRDYTNAVVKTTLLEVKAHQVVLGCTHFAFLERAIKKHLPDSFVLEPSYLVANELKQVLTKQHKLRHGGKGKTKLFFTGKHNDTLVRRLICVL